VILFVIDMMNSVHSLPTDLPTDFTDIINSIGNSVGKNNMSLFFFCFVLIFFFYCNSLGIYRENISVNKIPRKFTNKNIPLIFPFVFIDFLIVALFSLEFPYRVHFNIGNRVQLLANCLMLIGSSKEY